ncbi:MAG: tetratricopeptide repeat protein [Ferruginibacter sp.]
MPYRKHYLVLLLIIISIFSNKVYAQPTWTFDPFGKEKKPDKYEEKKLASEKTADKKFTTFRRFLQNNVTHYNYYFNANNRINLVVEKAKISNQDDYSRLLSFYGYSLDNTASQKNDLDSVIYKATAGILLHDLRSDWVDNMYLLIGKSYYFRKEFDSAALTFQFINYNLFPRKKKEDDNRIVGANESAKSSILSIANKENRNFVQKVMSLPPSRNDALIWLARTLTDQEEYSDATGMINILMNDPNLPKRLRNDLDEVSAYWFYKQEIYDSSAIHLERALSNAVTKQDKARWEYLLGQMFEMSGNYEKASAYYAKASKHTVDPIMDIYARLNDAKMFRDNGNVRELENSIAKLKKMARRDRYDSYRDIIYYSIGQLSLQKPDTASGKTQFSKSLKYNTSNAGYKNKAFLQLADIAYNEKEYKKASAYYDSIQLEDPSVKAQAAKINERKSSLSNIVAQINIIEREDSLQKVAAMPAAERDALIKKILKKYWKENGIKEEDNSAGNTLITFNNSKNNEPIDLFGSTSKGDWYFYNTSLKSRGFSDFKSKWGKRDNVDNWRRKSASIAKSNLNSGNSGGDPLDDKKIPGADPKTIQFSYEGLMSDLPLTPEQLDSSNKVIASSLVTLAKLFQNDLEDYKEAINTYENYLSRFPDQLLNGEVYLGLYFCYSKLGNTAKADYYKNLVTSNFAGSSAANKITNPSYSDDPNIKNPEVTRRYESIYDLFIEGKFAEATEAKKKADSVYGKNYWSPQLLYIEAIGYIKERKDSNAVLVLNDIISLYPNSPLKLKAETMIDVLKRRAEIETYLTGLEVTRVEEDKIYLSENNTIVIEKAVQNPTVIKPITPANKPVVQNNAGIEIPASMISGAFRWNPDTALYVVMILDKVDGVYINEAKNAFSRYNRENYFNKAIAINKDMLDKDKTLLVFATFADAAEAISYFDKIKKAAATEVSWLQQNKYSFLVISESNLQVLKSGKDINAYKTLLNNQYPGKF